jgi:Predicted permeases
MNVTFEMLLIVCPLALLAGFVDSVAGGGGLISLPAYYLAGLPPTLAAGTNKLSASIGTMASVYRYQKSGKIIWRAGLPAALMALPGSALGTQVLLHIPQNAVRWLVIIALPVVALVVLKQNKNLAVKARVPEKWLVIACFLIGFLIGFYDGLVGPGTGTFLILAFTMLLGMDAVGASGSAKVVNLASNIASLVTLLFSGSVLFALGLPAAVFGMAGNLIGASMTVKKGGGFIRVMLLVVLGLLLAKMVYDMVT